MASNVCVISGLSLAHTHGTGGQLLRFFEGAKVPFFHLYFTSFKYGKSECDNSYRLEDPYYWKFYRGRRFLIRLARRLKLSWWDEHNNVRPNKIQNLLKSNQLQADVVYAVVVSEDEAQRANSLIKYLNCPYVVHFMDLLHQEGLDPATMPGLRQLLCHASSVLVISEAMKREMLKFGISNITVIPPGQTVSEYVAEFPNVNQKIRLATIGSVHPAGLELLAAAWPELATRNPRLELLYAGIMQEDFPSTLKQALHYQGYISDKHEYQKFLASCHLAYMTGPPSLDCFGLFSVPSRLPDFFMAGLPVVACPVPGSATEGFLTVHDPAFVKLALTPAQVVQGVESFISSSERWQQASQQAHTFATQQLSIDIIRQTVFDKLSEAIG